MARLVLIGLPGVGKTTVARAVAGRWACPVVDTDALVGLREGTPAPQILRERGEEAFRISEVAALGEALASDAVVSTGAGVVTGALARQMLADQVTLWLDCDDATILARVADGDRPLLGDDAPSALARLRRERERWYHACARARVDATGECDEVVERVCATTSSLELA